MKEKIIDLALGAKRIAQKKEDAQSLLQALQKHLADDEKRLNTALQEKNWEVIFQITHRLLGALLYCGAPRLESACRDLLHALKLNNESTIILSTQRVLSEIIALKAFPIRRFITTAG